MKLTEDSKQKIIAVSIRLSSKNLSPDYYPFFEIPEARKYYMNNLYESLSPCHLCLDMKQLLNEIIIIWDGSKKGITNFLSYLSKIEKALANLNDFCKAQKWSYSIKSHMALDSGMAQKLIIPPKGNIEACINWTGMHADRVSSLTNEMQNGKYPDLLITHSFYEVLPISLQKELTTLYYVRHICCYSFPPKFPKEQLLK